MYRCQYLLPLLFICSTLITEISSRNIINVYFFNLFHSFFLFSVQIIYIQSFMNGINHNLITLSLAPLSWVSNIVGNRSEIFSVHSKAFFFQKRVSKSVGWALLVYTVNFFEIIFFRKSTLKILEYLRTCIICWSNFRYFESAWFSKW